MEQPNLNYINQLSGDNEEFKAKIIAIIKKELPEEKALYDSQMQNNDFVNATQSVHKLKHKTSILGLEASYYIAGSYEDNLKKGSTELQNEFDAILNLMQQFVNNL
jgi:HPt (histidine-containing phosphotransfer) domain-containing protein